MLFNWIKKAIVMLFASMLCTLVVTPGAWASSDYCDLSNPYEKFCKPYTALSDGETYTINNGFPEEVTIVITAQSYGGAVYISDQEVGFMQIDYEQIITMEPGEVLKKPLRPNEEKVILDLYGVFGVGAYTKGAFDNYHYLSEPEYIDFLSRMSRY
ncbi:hypothetical protein [Moorena producens]|uniref:hypothetical protein n=1 Tax=Moorena producens TaxID=1155739 RepID=UPI003C735A22